MNLNTVYSAVTEECSLHFGEKVDKILYHQNLNVFIVLSKDDSVRVFDTHTSRLLTDVSLKKHCINDVKNVQCVYHKKTGGILFSGGSHMGYRCDHQGVLLLKTILQPQVVTPGDSVSIEILFSEAHQLLQVLQEITVENSAKVIEALNKALSEAPTDDISNSKVAKWHTVFITVNFGELHIACASLVTELRKVGCFIPALSIVSGLFHRLNNLAPSYFSDLRSAEKFPMFSESARLATFTKWPHMDYKWALPEQMAQAGFFHQPEDSDDRTMCFICNLCLVYWEPTDEPWSEHERHSSNCPHVKGDHTHNVPLSITLATHPALPHSPGSVPIHRISSSNSDSFVASATANGNVVIWNIGKQYKREVKFVIDPSQSLILDEHFSDTIGYTDAPLDASVTYLKVSNFNPGLNKSTTRQRHNTTNWKRLEKKNSVAGEENKLNEHPESDDNLDSNVPYTTPEDATEDGSIDNQEGVTETSTKEVPDGENDDVNMSTSKGIDTEGDNSSSNVKDSDDSTTQNDFSEHLFTPLRPTQDVRVTSLSVFEHPNTQTEALSNQNRRSFLLVGVGLRRYELSNVFDGLAQDEDESSSKDSVVNSPSTSTPDLENEQPNENATSPSTDNQSKTFRNQRLGQASNTFVSYLLVYDLNVLYPETNTSDTKTDPEITKSVKKSSRKNTSLSKPVNKLKDELTYIDLSATFPRIKESKSNLSAINSFRKSPKCVQCLALPKKFNKGKQKLCVDNIIITPCDRFILVSLQKFKGGLGSEQIEGDGLNGGFILYRIAEAEQNDLLLKDPVASVVLEDEQMVAKEIVIYPTLNASDRHSDVPSKCIAGVVCVDGNLRILSVATLEYKYEINSSGSKFISLDYCHSLQRLCVVREDGSTSLVRLKLYHDQDSNLVSSDFNVSPTGFLPEDLNSSELLANQELTEDMIEKCSELTHFELGCPSIIAIGPPHWVELIQAQKKRKNPQHLQQHYTESARTWRLENDSSCTDHLLDFMIQSFQEFEAPSHICHVNVKLNLAPQNPLPKILITLLKRSTSSSEDFSADSKSANANSENSFLSREFLMYHRAEVLCGPIAINQFLDHSGQVANVTLTSMELLVCKSRSFLIHIKVLGSKDKGEIKVTADKSLNLGKNASGFSTVQKKGGNVIQEVSLNVHCCTPTNIPHERLQRLAMLNQHGFHESLLKGILCESNPLLMLHRSMNILLWILSIHASAGSFQNSDSCGSALVLLLKESLEPLVEKCVLGDDRSIAHLTVEIIVLVAESLPEGNERRLFAENILKSLLNCFNLLPSCKSAGGIYWFFSLLNHVKWVDPTATANKVSDMLGIASKVLRQKVGLTQTILHTKFGLHRRPFERHLFDTFPPLMQSISSNPKSTLNNPHFPLQMGNSNAAPYYIQTNPLNWENQDQGVDIMSFESQSSPSSLSGPYGQNKNKKSVLSSGTEGKSLDGTRVSRLCGLLEVEQLHFNLQTCSDGIKIERILPGSRCSVGSYFAHSAFKMESEMPFPNTDSSKIEFNSSHTNKLFKAAEDMESMINKNQTVGVLLSKKISKSYVDKAKRSENEVAEKMLNLSISKIDEDMCGTSNDQVIENDALSPISQTPSTLSDSSPDANCKWVNAPSDLLEITKGCDLKCSDDKEKILEVTESEEVKVLVNEDSEEHVLLDSPESVHSQEVLQDNLVSSSDVDKDSDGLNEVQITSELHVDIEDCELLGNSKELSVHNPTNDAEETDGSVTETLKGTHPSSPISGGEWGLHQQLLSIPPQHMMIIERMHSGARRFVILDFGVPVVLTDIAIPACKDLASLTVDIWLTREDLDVERLVVASDISHQPLILSDIRPPPICRYLKLTALGRYGMVTASCRIPLGSFYGHSIIMPWHLPASHSHPSFTTKRMAEIHLSVLNSLVEDVSCRYNLACSNLETLLEPYVRGADSDIWAPKDASQSTENKGLDVNNVQDKKIIFTYQECIAEQHHLNLIFSLICRLKKYIQTPSTEVSSGCRPKKIRNCIITEKDMDSCSLDQLSTVVQYLLNCLLTLSHPAPPSSILSSKYSYRNLLFQLESWCGPVQAKSLIENVCVIGTKELRVSVLSLLSRLCPSQIWWGDFLCSLLVPPFAYGNVNHSLSNRVFSIVSLLGQKSIMSGHGSPVLEAVMNMVLNQLNSTTSSEDPRVTFPSRNTLFGGSAGYMDLNLVSQLLLFLSLCLDMLASSSDVNHDSRRWRWLNAETFLQTKESDCRKNPPKSTRELLRKRLVHHKERLVNLKTATKSFKEVLAGLGSAISPKMMKQSEQVFKKIQKQHALKHYKDLCSIQRNEGPSLRRNNRPGNAVDADDIVADSVLYGREIKATLERPLALNVVKALIKLLVQSEEAGSTSDVFLLTCKVIGGLAKVSRPTLRIGEFFSEENLVTLLVFCIKLEVTWNCPWALHGLTCLLLDVLEGERRFGSEVTIRNDNKQNETDSNKGGNLRSPNNMNDNQTSEQFSMFASEAAQAISADGETSEAVPGPSSSSVPFAGSVEASSLEVPDKSPSEDKSAEGDTGQSVLNSLAASNGVDQSTSPMDSSVVDSLLTTIVENDYQNCKCYVDSSESSGSDDIEFLGFPMDLPNSSSANQNNPTEDVFMFGSTSNHSDGPKQSSLMNLVSSPILNKTVPLPADQSFFSRFESGIFLTAELRIHVMNALHASRLKAAISEEISVTSLSWHTDVNCSRGDLKESIHLLTGVFQTVFNHISCAFNTNYLVSVLEMWLKLNVSLSGGEYNRSLVPVIPLHSVTVSALLSVVGRAQHISVRCWCLLLQTLTLCTNLNSPEDTSASLRSHNSISQCIIGDSNFIPVLISLFSGSYESEMSGRMDMVGSTLAGFLEDFLFRLKLRCDVMNTESSLGNNLKLSFLKLLTKLIKPGSQMAWGLGPLDAQKTLLSFMMSMSYVGLSNSINVPLSLIASIASIVRNDLSLNQDVSMSSPAQKAPPDLEEIFASVFGGTSTGGCNEVIPTRKVILSLLLNLASKLAQIPLDPNKANPTDLDPSSEIRTAFSTRRYEERCLTDTIKLKQKQQVMCSSRDSQTDEHKAMNPRGNVPADENNTESRAGPRIQDSDEPAAEWEEFCYHTEANRTVYLADLVVQCDETMNNLLHALSEYGPRLSAQYDPSVNGEVSGNLATENTVSEFLYQLLLTLNKRATNVDQLLTVLLNFIQSRNSLCDPEFSDALFCYFGQVLDCKAMLSKFASAGGTELLWRNLVRSSRAPYLSERGMVSSMLKRLSPPLPATTKTTSLLKRIDPTTGLPLTVESGIPKGLYNFAPLASVSSSNPTARPADSVIKNSQYFHRTMNPPWSYHFCPEENWVDLTLTLPCPILLHEIQLHPHTMALGMCPSSISVESGLEKDSLIPITGVVCTAGLTNIQVSLRRPTVASIILIRLHRPGDQSTIGLSHLKLLGTTTFNDAENSVTMLHRRSAYWWLKLIHHCTAVVIGGEGIMIRSSSPVDDLMGAMVSLLTSSPLALTNYDIGGQRSFGNEADGLRIPSSIIETVTLSLVTHNEELLEELLKCLFSHPVMEEQGSPAVEAAVSLLRLVSCFVEGEKLLVQWFSKMVDHQATAQETSRGLVSLEIVRCFAVIIWNLSDSVLESITKPLFKKLCSWCRWETGNTKECLDYVVCAMCKVQPVLFSELLIQLGILTPADASLTAISDDSKDRASVMLGFRTDDMKESGETLDDSNVDGVNNPETQYILQDPCLISLSRAQLQTVSVATLSSPGARVMLDSGFALLLVHGILEWCKFELIRQVDCCANVVGIASESATDTEKANLDSHRRCSSPEMPHSLSDESSNHFDTALVIHTLEALTKMAEEPLMQEWLGSGDGSVFWMSLLTVLGDPVMHASEVSVRMDEPDFSSYSRVEGAAIQLFRAVCEGHKRNQTEFSALLCRLIQRQPVANPGDVSYLHCLSGFTRRLVLQAVLESETVLVHVSSTSVDLSATPLHVATRQGIHPKFGTGSRNRVLRLPTSTKIGDLVKLLTDSLGTLDKGNGKEVTVDSDGIDGDTYKKEIGELGLELVDKLSIAAGVTAKEKRATDKAQNNNYGQDMPSFISDSKTRNTDGSTGPRSELHYGMMHLGVAGSGCLPAEATLSQVVAALDMNHDSDHRNVLELTLVAIKPSDRNPTEMEEAKFLLSLKSRPSMLTVFSNCGGLSALAEHLALLYPSASYQSCSPSSIKPCEESKKDKSEEMSGIAADVQLMFPEFYSSSPIGASSLSGCVNVASIPPHALGAFVLFLRLPGYSEALLCDSAKACALLRMTLGAHDAVYEGQVSDEPTLATLPFQVLEYLLRSTPLTTDDGLMLRKTCLSTGVLNLVMACLVALSHQDNSEVISSLQHENVPVSIFISTARGTEIAHDTQGEAIPRTDRDRGKYWAKGTGYGTGPINQSWNVEMALYKQKMEEEHIVWLIKILAQYINPGDGVPKYIQEYCGAELLKFSEENTCAPVSVSHQLSLSPDNDILNQPEIADTSSVLPNELLNLLLGSKLVDIVAYYLNNDSVLDMSRHVQLYQALLSLMRALIVTPLFLPLLSTSHGSSDSMSGPVDSTKRANPRFSDSLPLLLTKMKAAVNAYLSKLKWNKNGRSKSKRTAGGLEGSEEPQNDTGVEQRLEATSEFFGVADSDDQGLSRFVADVYFTSKVVQIGMKQLKGSESVDTVDDGGSAENDIQFSSLHDIYLKTMKPLQFDMYDMIVEDTERGGIRFVVPYHYETEVRDVEASMNCGRMKRLAQEAVTLSTSLPLSYSSSVFVRTDTDRLDVMKILIIGPEDTPYANGCFEFDVFFSNNYPQSPLFINLQTTGEKRVRFNPNLYQDGKVCLSILNTWHGKPEEKWNPQTSSLLQVLVSIQSLILVPDPYFNEPGYEKFKGTPNALHASQEYDAGIKVATVRWGILNQIRNPSPCFKEVIEKHFWLKRVEISVQVHKWAQEVQDLNKNEKASKRIPQHATALKKLQQILFEDFAKMTTPVGLEKIPQSRFSATCVPEEAGSSSSKQATDMPVGLAQTWYGEAGLEQFLGPNDFDSCEESESSWTE